LQPRPARRTRPPPLITEDTGTQGKGVYQLEFTVEVPRETRYGASYDGTEVSGVLNSGVAENIDLQLVVPYLGAWLIASYEPGPIGVHADLGYRYLDNVLGLREHLYHASASLHYLYHDTLKFVADTSVENTLDPGPTDSVRYSTLGVIWSVAPGVGIGCGIKYGLSELAIDRIYLCGMGWRLN